MGNDKFRSIAVCALKGENMTSFLGKFTVKGKAPLEKVGACPVYVMLVDHLTDASPCSSYSGIYVLFDLNDSHDHRSPSEPPILCMEQ